MFKTGGGSWGWGENDFLNKIYTPKSLSTNIFYIKKNCLLPIICSMSIFCSSPSPEFSLIPPATTCIKAGV